jgi:hypothetical protein
VSGELILPSGQEVRSFEWEKIKKNWSGLFRVDKVNAVRDKISNGVNNFE